MTTGWELSNETLQRIGKQAGFDAIGATTANAFPELVPRLTAYEERGLTGFEHAEIERRVNPKTWFENAESLIAVALAYLTPEGIRTSKGHPKSGQHGVITVYSYGEDYHTVMQRRFQKLIELIEEELGHPVQSKLAVDTAPLVDRRVAERAGIGWVGKNCMFYTPEHGSFVFLGTLAVDIRVEPAIEEQEPLCGACTRCLDACPTGALVAPGVIDAPRCLSYITQMKGSIPREFRSAMGRRVWGCDTCQWACPENKGVSRAENAEFLPQGELEFPDLIEVLTWSNRSFLKRYGHTAAAWRGLRTWQRNALIALGNSKKEEATLHIVPFLESPRQELRISAAWALGKIRSEEALQALNHALCSETDPEVCDELRLALQGGV